MYSLKWRFIVKLRKRPKLEEFGNHNWLRSVSNFRRITVNFINWMSTNSWKKVIFHYQSNPTDDYSNFWINFVINICWNICQWRIIIQVLVQYISETDDIFGVYSSNFPNWLTLSVDILRIFLNYWIVKGPEVQKIGGIFAPSCLRCQWQWRMIS